ncbi:cbb3-type cytochrome c oxidase subunit I [Sulfitobacter sp.]|uniref:cbb3-type cytochrome c oxidase subunit I n=1 Tax=Sulfitobacter sp. TaxID=1903071 RepID=UPI003001341F
MLYSILLVACAILAPLFAHLRQWKPAALFAVVALVYVIFGGISLANVLFVLNKVQDAEPPFHDTYFVISRGHAFFSLGIVMAFFAAVTWLQTRCGAMLHPRITKILFWILHLGLIGTSSLPTVWSFFMVPPRRYIEYAGHIETYMMVSTWVSFANTLAALSLIALLIWSVIFKKIKGLAR